MTTKLRTPNLVLQTCNKLNEHFFKLLFLVFFIGISVDGNSQTTIKSQSFDAGVSGYSDDLNYTVTNSTNGFVSSTTSESSPNSFHFRGGNGDTQSRLTFEDVDISLYTSVTVTVSFASTDVENSEDLRFYISYDGGSNYTMITKLIDGDNPGDNINWGNSDTESGSVSNPYTFSVPDTETSVRVQVRSDDDQENDDYFYVDNILIEGVSSIPLPEIDVLGNGNLIVSGDTSPSTFDDTNFYSNAISTSETHTFTIDNSAGTEVLTISSISSDDGEFTLASIPTSVAIGATSTFDVIYTPTVAGPNTATITINNNDPDPSEATYTFQVEGSVIVSSVSSVGPNGEWKYLDDGSNQGTSWNGTGFDDSSWASGNAELGFGDGDETTIVADNDQVTTYFRKSFIADANDIAFDYMVLNAIRDDGMVVYLNGVQIWSDNMPGSFDYSTLSSGTIDNAAESTWINTTIANALVVGTNVLAVEIHQRSATSSDISFNFDLELINDNIYTSGGLWYYEDDGTNQGIAWQTDTGLYSTWTSGNAELGFGDGDETTVVADNNQITTYFRKSFDIDASQAAFDYVRLNSIFDDGIVVYIDGTEVWRNNMPSGAISFNTTANNSIAVEDEWKNNLISNFLTVGTHEIAVEIHNSSATNGDISFDFFIDFINDSGIYASGGAWFYLDDGSDQGTAWQTDASLYNSWSGGNAQLGYSEGEESDEITLVSYGPDVDDKHKTTYFRRSFDVSAAQLAFSTLALNAIADDGMVVYIDGTEVWRYNMPTGAITNTTLANGNATEGSWLTQEMANSLTVGSHEIAVEIHQYSGDSTVSSSDISFDFYLEFNNYLIGSGGSWHYLDDGSNQGTAWRTDTGLFSTWASGNSELGFGDGDEITTVAENNQVTTYFRKQVPVSGADVSNSTLVLQAVRDDGIVVYINGVEVWRDNMAIGALDYLSVARSGASGSEESTWITYKLENLLISGVNEIAVEVHNESASDGDISFNFRMFTDDSFVFVPPNQPDYDGDLIVDYKDVDDDNDGISDIVEGCILGNLELIGTGSSGQDITNSFPKSIALDDGNSLNFSKAGTFDEIEKYDAGDHGWAIRVKGPNTSGTITMSFDTAVDNLSFKLIDFDEDETWTVNAYDSSNNLVDLTSTGKVYHLGSYIDQSGNTFSDVNNGLATNNNGEDEINDAYGTAYFYFPDNKIKRVEFIIYQPGGSSIRLAGINYCDVDTDSDTIQNYQDSDSDNDGIPDVVEAGGTDIDGNGIIDDLTDIDQDGLADIVDSDPTNYNTYETSVLESVLDFDGDGIINSLDLDSDNDGIVDLIETFGAFANSLGQIAGFTDSDNNGYHDAFEGAGSILITGADTNSDGFPNSYPNANGDSNGFPNFLDIDSDDDGIPDNIEAQPTGSFLNYVNTNMADTDGIANIFDAMNGFGGQGLLPIDTDFDCIPDYLDTNSDDDLEDDIVEGFVVDGNTLMTGLDSDNDGLDNGFDANDSTINPSNSGLSPSDYPYSDGGYDADWRYTISPIDFDGINDHIDFGDNHDITSSFSLEAWILQKATMSIGTIISKRDAKTGNYRGYHLIIDGDNKPNLTWYNSSGVAVISITSDYEILNDKWYHIAATYNGSEAKIYVDGLEVATGNTSTAPLSGSEKFMVGAMFTSVIPCVGAVNHFEGYIDEIRLWNVALSASQIREMMNQEIKKSGSSVGGAVVPLTISSNLSWSSLQGYYPMSNDRIDDHSQYSNNGIPRSIHSIEFQTAPIPYTTKSDGDGKWDTPASWTYGETVWNMPNSVGVDGTTSIDWNIVRTSHNIDADRSVKVLGLLVDSNELQINGTTDMSTGTGAGYGLEVSHYLHLSGKIDLEGGSQLIQTEGSVLSSSITGELERDQQGTASSFNYNYWSSSVGSKIAGTDINNNYTLKDVLRDGTTGTPRSIVYQNHWIAADGNFSLPLSQMILSRYWLWTYNDVHNTYSKWNSINENSSLQPGIGYTMKGVSGSSDNTDYQNYAYVGRPFNGNITVHVDQGNDVLIGNPYPSAMDADEFIKDNLSGGHPTNTNVFNGALYFWHHFTKTTHILREYVGGYATYTLMGGVRAYSNGELIDNSNPNLNGGRIPERFIPVNQGFFVYAVSDTVPNTSTPVLGGDIMFKNSQRVFELERYTGLSNSGSLFFKSSTKKGEKETQNQDERIDKRKKIRLTFDSPKGYNRQLLVGADENASDNFDLGYDGLLIDLGKEDMFWNISGGKFVIQAVSDFQKNREILLGLQIEEAGLIKISIDELENLDENINLYIKDNSTGETYQINNKPFEINLEVGEYLDRFRLVFQPRLKTIEEVKLENGFYVHMDNSSEELQISKIVDTQIQGVNIYNSLGQIISSLNKRIDERDIYVPFQNVATGVYIVEIKTKNGSTVKKIIKE